MIMSLLLAVFAEIPLALICLWIALHATHLIEARAVLLARRAARAEARAQSHPQTPTRP
jgi:hypothetical protein